MAQEKRLAGGLGRLSLVAGMLCAIAAPALAQGTPGQERFLMFGSVQASAERLDSLEQVARNAMNGAAGRSALQLLAQHGKVWAYHHETAPVIVYPGIVSRLRRIYALATPLMRSAIVADLFLQAEQRDAITFLAELAMSRDMGLEYNSIAEQAVEILSMLGTPGEEELRRLHHSGKAPEEIQETLDRLARNGYRRLPVP